MRVAEEVSPFRFPRGGWAAYRALAEFVHREGRRLDPRYTVDMDRVQETREETAFDYCLDRWRHGRGERAVVVSHRVECVEMGAVTTSADTVTVTAEGLSGGRTLELRLVRAPRDADYNATLRLESECAPASAEALLREFHRSFGEPAEDEVSRGLDTVADPAEAESLLARLSARLPRPDLTPAEVDGVLREALGYLRPYGWENAARNAKKVLRFRRDPQAVFVLGVAHGARGRHAQAEVFLRMALRDLPRSYDAWYNLGLCLEETGRTEESVRCFQTTLRIDPGNPRALEALQRVRGASQAGAG